MNMKCASEVLAGETVCGENGRLYGTVRTVKLLKTQARLIFTDGTRQNFWLDVLVSAEA